MAEALKLKNRFLNWGYPSEIIEEAYQFAAQQKRNELLVPRQKKSEDLIRIIGTYDEGIPMIRQLLSKYWYILKADPDLKDILPDTPRLTFRRGRNIKDRIVKSHLPPTPGPRTWLGANIPCGTFPCGDCSACDMIIRGDEFQSAPTGKRFKIKYVCMFARKYARLNVA